MNEIHNNPKAVEWTTEWWIKWLMPLSDVRTSAWILSETIDIDNNPSADFMINVLRNFDSNLLEFHKTKFIKFLSNPKNKWIDFLSYIDKRCWVIIQLSDDEVERQNKWTPKEYIVDT